MYKIVTFYANLDKSSGIYGDIYRDRLECIREHPQDEVLTGFGIVDASTGVSPDQAEDWYTTKKSAQEDLRIFFS